MTMWKCFLIRNDDHLPGGRVRMLVSDRFTSARTSGDDEWLDAASLI